MAWLYLVVAGVLEVIWAIGLKNTDGWTRWGWNIFTAVGMVASFYFLSLALRVLPIGTAYAIWTGIGAVGTVLVGMFWLGEPRDVARLLCILLIVAGIVGLKVVTPAAAG